jgi:hypothetical protein
MDAVPNVGLLDLVPNVGQSLPHPVFSDLCSGRKSWWLGALGASLNDAMMYKVRLLESNFQHRSTARSPTFGAG